MTPYGLPVASFEAAKFGQHPSLSDASSSIVPNELYTLPSAKHESTALFSATLSTGANAGPPAERALLLQEFVEAEQINPDAAVQMALPHVQASLLLHSPLVFVQVARRQM